MEELCLGVGVIGVAEKPLPHSDLSSSSSSAPPVSSVCYHSPTTASFVQICGFPDEIYQAFLSTVQGFIVTLRQLSYTIKNQLNSRHPKPPTRGSDAFYAKENLPWQNFVKLRARVDQSEMSKYHNFSPLQNSPGETTWRLWATSSSTSSAGPCPGKDSERRQRLRNTRKSARRSCRPRWRSFVKEHQVGNTFLPADDTGGGRGRGGENSAFQTKQSEK